MVIDVEINSNPVIKYKFSRIWNNQFSSSKHHWQIEKNLLKISDSIETDELENQFEFEEISSNFFPTILSNSSNIRQFPSLLYTIHA